MSMTLYIVISVYHGCVSSFDVYTIIYMYMLFYYIYKNSVGKENLCVTCTLYVVHIVDCEIFVVKDIFSGGLQQLILNSMEIFF